MSVTASKYSKGLKVLNKLFETVCSQYPKDCKISALSSEHGVHTRLKSRILLQSYWYTSEIFEVVSTPLREET